MTEPKTKHYKREKEEKTSKEDAQDTEWGDTIYISDEEDERKEEKTKVEQGYTWD